MTGKVTVIVKPNGRTVRVGVYVTAWKMLKRMPKVLRECSTIRDWAHFPCTPDEVLAELRRGMDNRINRHDPAYDRGRKWLRWSSITRRASSMSGTAACRSQSRTPGPPSE